MMKYDIGILTFWNVPNFGTYAQAYALQRVLQELNNEKDVRQIAHLDRKHFNFYYDKKRYYKKFPVWKKSFWKSFFIKDNSSVSKEKKFINAYALIPHTENISVDNLKDFKFDKVFLGSDIVWDYSIKVFNNDPLLFGQGFNVGELNAYAASFGTVPVDAKVPDYVNCALKKMKYISVRDERSAEIVENVTGIKPPIVLDPTWLWDFNKDENIIKPIEKDYILVYGQDFTPVFIENLRKYANESNKKIIALDCNEDHYDWCDKMIGQTELSPFQWIGYFKHATLIATSTFHGITFSLLFNKKFAFCKTEFIMAKIDEFLRELKLFELFDTNQDDVVGMFNHDFNYGYINKIIEGKRNASLDFLRKACND